MNGGRAPTLDLIFSAEPGLEQALINLGITVRTPEDLARALRDNPALINLGFITGIGVELSPKRLQTGFNLGWSSSGDGRDRLHLLGIYNQDKGINSTRNTLLATLSYSRRIFHATDIYAAYSWWRSGLSSLEESGSSVDIGLRQQFDGLPRFMERSGIIQGFVFLDPEMRGARGPETQPLADIAITLDGGLSARTDRSGAYSFDHVPPGPHRIAAQLPVSPRAFFTTPSYSETKAPAHVDFGLVWAASRIDGRVTSDAGVGIGGVVLSAATGTGQPTSTTSDGEGRFTFAVMAGTFRIALAKESLPDGYELAGLPALVVQVETDKPQTVTFEVRALRSVSGHVSGATEVKIESIGRTASVDAAGNFVFRSMPPGTFTLTASSRGRSVSSVVTLPVEPTTIGDVVLSAPSVESASGLGRKSAPVAKRVEKAPAVETTAPPGTASIEVRNDGPSTSGPWVAGPEEMWPKVSTAPPPQAHGAFRVQAGAFRSAANAMAAQHRIEELGGHAEIRQSGFLNLVTIGPFDSREAAIAEVGRLKRANIDAVVKVDHENASAARLPIEVRVVPVAAPPVPVAETPAPVVESHPAAPLVRTMSAMTSATTSAMTSPVSPGANVVYAGAFGNDRDAGEVRARLQRSGERAFTAIARGLTIVYVGPFATRQEAVAASERLRRIGIDSFVTRR